MKASLQTNAEERKRIRLMLFMMIVTSLSGPWWLPYTGLSLSFPLLVIVAIIGCVASVAAVLIGVRIRQTKHLREKDKSP